LGDICIGPLREKLLRGPAALDRLNKLLMPLLVRKVELVEAAREAAGVPLCSPYKTQSTVD